MEKLLKRNFWLILSSGRSLGKLDEFLGARLRVSWSSSYTICLNTEVVLVHSHVEEAPIAPVGTPRVAADPVLLAIRTLAVPNDSDGMVELRSANILRVDVGAIISIELISGLDGARDWTILELSLHLVSTTEVVV